MGHLERHPGTAAGRIAFERRSSKDQQGGWALDVQVHIFEEFRASFAWLDSPWLEAASTARSVPDLLLGLACLSMAAIILWMLVPRLRRPDTPPPSPPIGWILGITLVLCGFSQFIRPFVAPLRPAGRIRRSWRRSHAGRRHSACASPVTRAAEAVSEPEPVAPDESEPPTGEVDVHADTVVVLAPPNPHRLADELRRSEARVREFAEADAARTSSWPCSVTSYAIPWPRSATPCGS